jgi:hypothetical protein
VAFAEGVIVMVHAIRATANNEPTRDFAVVILGRAFHAEFGGIEHATVKRDITCLSRGLA